jgi:dihydrofolate reductase
MKFYADVSKKLEILPQEHIGKLNGDVISMRSISAGLFISLDGVVEAPSAWGFQFMDEEMSRAISEGISQADTVLLGRRTYLEFADIWPDQGSDAPMSNFLNHSHKYVVSTTLDSLSWQPASLIQGDIAHEIYMLKQQSGKNIQVPGSPTLVRFLIQNSLLNVLSLTICPVVVGCGMRLFDDMDISFKMKLVHSNTLKTGAIGATYQVIPGINQPDRAAMGFPEASQKNISR